MINDDKDIFKIEQIHKDLFRLFDQKKKNLFEKYRFKSLKYYQKQIRKPFNYKTMQNYEEIAKFQNNFDKYIEQNQQMLKVKQIDDLDARQSIKNIKKKDIFQTLLTLDKEKSLSIDQYNKKSQNIRFKKTKGTNKKMMRQSQIRIPSKVQIYFDSASSSPESFKKSIISKTIGTKSKLKKNPTFLFNTPHQTISKKKTSSFISNQYISQQQIFESLKFHLKINNFKKGVRIDVSQFSNFLIKHEGNQIITKYYDMPKLLSVKNICQITNNFYKSSKMQKNLITFLTYDLDKDGIISQQDLFKIYNSIDVDSNLHQDIYKLHQYSKKYNTKDLTPDINTNFVLNPSRNFAQFVIPQKFKKKLFFSSNNKEVSANKSQSKIQYLKQKGKNTFLFTNILQKDQQLNSFKLQNNQKTINKKIKINFQFFCKVFQELPVFAQNFLNLFKYQKKNTFEQSKEQRIKIYSTRKIPQIRLKNQRQNLIRSNKNNQRKKLFSAVKRQVTLPINLNNIQQHQKINKPHLILQPFKQRKQNPEIGMKRKDYMFEDYFFQEKTKKQIKQVDQKKLKQANEKIRKI